MNLLDRFERLAEVARRLCFAEGGSRLLQIAPNPLCGRVCTTEHASGGPFRILERRHGFAEIVERGGGVLAERPRVKQPHHERDKIFRSENASCHGNCFAQQCLSFFEALEIQKGIRVVVGCPNGIYMFFTK